jgi:hypothetical protein
MKVIKHVENIEELILLCSPGGELGSQDIQIYCSESHLIFYTVPMIDDIRYEMKLPISSVLAYLLEGKYIKVAQQ